MVDSVMGSLKIKCRPLISFYTIVDCDLGVCNLALSQYNKSGIFDVSDVGDDLTKLIDKIYHRETENPLVAIINKNSNYSYKNGKSENKFLEFLDECYSDFRRSKCKEIYDLGVITDIANLCAVYKSSAEVKPTILCYDDFQLETIREINALDGIPVVHFESIKDSDPYSQLFLRSIEEAKAFANFRAKTFYFAASTLNINVLNDNYYDNEIINLILSNENKISIFDMYNSNIFRKED